jgi:long-chain acyl-CoA synthetase
MLVWEILHQTAERHPHRPAVWFKDRWVTYGELAGNVNRLAGYLATIGIRPGDRVGILLDNSFDYIIAHFAVLRAGAVDVSLNTELKRDGLAAQLLDCEAKALIGGTKFMREWQSTLGKLPRLEHVLTDGKPQPVPALGSGQKIHSLGEIMRENERALPRIHRIDIDLASIVYTSGVTGQAKGVMLSHLNLISNTRSIVQYLGLSPDDRMMVVLPFYYIYGRSLLYSHFFSGGSLVIDNRFAFPATVLNVMEAQEVTCLAGVPSTFAILLNKTDVRSRRFARLRLVTQAGGGMAPALQRAVAQTFHPARLVVMYGSTETAPRLTYLDPEALPRKWGSIGKAIPNVDVFVANDSGQPLPPGIPGEIVARGSNIMMGYWKDPEGTARVLRHGCYFTGDLGFADEEGFLFLTGRARDMIKTGGNRVSGKEIEDAILENPDVLEAAVIGVADPILGEAVKAFVVPNSAALTETALRQDLGRRLPSFKLPKWLEFREHLPKNQAGKILKSALRAESGSAERSPMSLP